MDIDQQNVAIPKVQQRRFYDTSSSYVTYLKNRVHIRNHHDMVPIFPSSEYTFLMPAPISNPNDLGSLLTIRYCHTSSSKERSEILSLSWSPGGRRIISGSKNGQLTLWDGSSFHKEKFLSGSQEGIKCLCWSHNEKWLVTGDQLGEVAFRKPTLDLLFSNSCHDKMIKAISFSPTDTKFLTCSDDSKVKIWIFDQSKITSIFEYTDHGNEVNGADWHPFYSLIASGGKDNLIKIWDPRIKKTLHSLTGHNGGILKVLWNRNGNWLAASSLDATVQIYDIRTMSKFQELVGQNKYVTSLTWHPICEDLLTGGTYEGAIHFWKADEANPIHSIPQAHFDDKDGKPKAVNDLIYHPDGHLLCSGGNDSMIKMWIRPRPGDKRELDYQLIARNGYIEKTIRQEAASANIPCLSVEPVPNILVSKLGIVNTTRDLTSDEPPENYQCSKCHGSTHWLSKCPYYNTPVPGYICKICHKSGHWVEDCPTRIPPGDYVCELCHEPGHWKKDCPRNTRRNN